MTDISVKNAHILYAFCIHELPYKNTLEYVKKSERIWSLLDWEDYFVSEIDHFVRDIDHFVSDIDPFVSEIDHFVSEIDPLCERL